MAEKSQISSFNWRNKHTVSATTFLDPRGFAPGRRIASIHLVHLARVARSPLFVLFVIFVSRLCQADTTSLLQDLASTDGKIRLEALDEIRANRLGADAIAPAAQLLDSPDPAIAGDAKIALERIVGPLSLVEDTRAAASLALCDALASAKNPAGRTWLLWLLSYTGGAEAVPRLAKLLADPDSFSMAVFALQGIGGEPASQALIAALKRTSDTPRRIALINALAMVGGKKAESALIAAAKAPDDASRAALEALGHVGGSKSAKLLGAKLRDGHGPGVVAAYLRVAERQQPRRARELYAQLLKANRDPNVDCAALTGLGRTGRAQDVAAVLPHFSTDRADVYGAARGALLALPDAKADRAIARAFESAESAETRCALLDVLNERNPEFAAPYLEAALKDPDETLRAAAYELRGRAAEPRHESELLEAAKSESDAVRPVALRGYLRIADAKLARGERPAALDMYHAALETATRNEERLLALEGMTRIGDPLSLPHIQSHMHEEALGRQLALCALAVADNIRGTDPSTAYFIYSAMVERAPFVDLAERAADGLKALGKTSDAARRLGFVTHWKLIGPFPNNGFEAALPPEAEYKPDAAYAGAGGRTIRWTDHRVEHVRGITELHRIMTPNENIVVYARAEIEVEQPADAVLLIGSDDGVVCWLNGEKVHSNKIDRKVTVDQDRVPVRLRAGKNVILLKIVQGGGGMGYCLRIVDANEKPLSFLN